jgi:crotonobetainyl-CoA:carnitine CoA-transferase CaiB-like acyl-CoA transferase
VQKHVLEARQSKVGREIDIALYEPTLAMLGDIVLEFSLNGKVRQGSDVVICPRGSYLAKDGKWVIIAASTNSVAKRLFDAMGRADVFGRYPTNDARVEHRDIVQAAVAEWASSKTRDDLLATLRAHEVAAGPANDAGDLATDAHFRERGSIRMVDSALFGANLAWPGTILTMPGYPPAEYRDPPRLGEHTDEILSAAGVSPEELAELRSAGTIG